MSTSGIRIWDLEDEKRKRWDDITRGGLFGPWDKPDLGVEKMPAGLNPGGCEPWGSDSFQLFPNFTILIWAQGWYLTYHYWPTSAGSHVFEGTLYFVPAQTARERIAHEMAAATFKEYGLQDANTLEATQSIVQSRVVRGSRCRTRRYCAATSTGRPPSGWPTTRRRRRFDPDHQSAAG